MTGGNMRRLTMSKTRFTGLLLLVSLTMAVFAGGRSQRETGQGAAAPMTIITATYQTAPWEPNGKISKYYNELFNVDWQVMNIEQASYTEILNLKLAANEAPDMFAISTADMQKYVDQQVLAEIPEQMLMDTMPDWIASARKTDPDFLRYAKVDGKYYGVERGLLTIPRAPLMYRGDWIQNVGKTGTPKTLAEFEELMYLFANNDPDGNGRRDTYGLSADGLKGVYGAFGYVRGQWNEKDGGLVYSSVQPEMKDALALISKWYRDGVLDPEFVTGENKGGYWALSHSFIEGKIGFTSHGYYYHWPTDPNHPETLGANGTEMEKLNAAAVRAIVNGVPFTGPSGKSGVDIQNPHEGRHFVFNANISPAKMQKCLEIMNHWFKVPEDYVQANMGFKGEDWDIVDGLATAIGQAKEDGTYLPRNGGYLYYRQLYTDEGQQFINRLYNIPDTSGYLRDWYTGYMNKKIVGTPSEAQYSTELAKIEDEAYLAIITGERPISYFDEFVAQWRRAGGDILIREVNEWWNSLK
jgi:putative aldouronate transport system substrate-binding protein